MSYEKPNLKDENSVEPLGTVLIAANVNWMVNANTTANVNEVANVNVDYNYNITDK